MAREATWCGAGRQCKGQRHGHKTGAIWAKLLEASDLEWSTWVNQIKSGNQTASWESQGIVWLGFALRLQWSKAIVQCSSLGGFLKQDGLQVGGVSPARNQVAYRHSSRFWYIARGCTLLYKLQKLFSTKPIKLKLSLNRLCFFDQIFVLKVKSIACSRISLAPPWWYPQGRWTPWHTWCTSQAMHLNGELGTTVSGPWYSSVISCFLPLGFGDSAFQQFW